MPSKDLFLKRVYEIVNELKIPLIDERVFNRFDVSESRYPIVCIFKFDEDESVIRGFLGLAEYFHTIIYKLKNSFYIPYGGQLYKLIS